MNFFTHRDTQPVSRWTRDLVVKSSTQESKQWVTRLENMPMNSFICFLSIRVWSSLCSEAVSESILTVFEGRREMGYSKTRVDCSRKGCNGRDVNANEAD